MERQGRRLRVFDDDALPDALSVLVSDLVPGVFSHGCRD
jgi:hypothetical protein